MSREIDAMVAEKIFGLDLSKYPIQHERVDIESRSIMNWEEDYPAYSTDIACAWTVVEKLHQMQAPGGHVGQTMLHSLRSCAGGQWEAMFCSDFGYTKAAKADTAPMAICLAALAAVGVEAP